MKVLVAGLKSSGVNCAVASEKGLAKTWPPVMKTVPSGRMTLLAKARWYAMLPIVTTVGAAGGVPMVIMWAFEVALDCW